MSITDELREWWVSKFPVMDSELHKDFTAIAGRIDAEHEKECAKSWMRGHDVWASVGNDDKMAELGWMRLPKDADGEYIHIGDMMVSKDGKVHRVDSLTRNPTWFDYEWSIRLALLNDGVGVGSLVRYRPDTLRHYHAPTVEDVLREFAAEFNRDDSELCDEEIIEQFADKLQLKEGE